MVAAYVAVPTERAEAESFYAALRAEPYVAGLEVPCSADGSLQSPFGESWLVDQLDSAWSITLTTLPSTMVALAASAEFGLASTSQSGRRAAIDVVAGALDAAARLKAERGLDVPAVLVHSAPRSPLASADALAASLHELGNREFGSTKIVIEHCDAASADHVPAKGFLDLDLELKAIEASPRIGGLLVNWGRSAIETRNADGPVVHVERARDAGMLYGVVFSGASDQATVYGEPWADAHLPLAGEVESLMSAEEIGRTLRASGRDVVLGVKVAARPDMDLDTRLGFIRAAAAAVAAV